MVRVGSTGVTEVEVDGELKDDDEEEVDEEVLEGVEEVEDGLGVGGLLGVVEGDGLLVEAGLFAGVETEVDVGWNGFPLYA